MEEKLEFIPPQVQIIELKTEGVICGSGDVPGAGGEGLLWE